MQKEDFKFSFEKDIFLDPSLLKNELEKLESAGQKLEFVYDYIYNNTHKNRFALFKDSDRSECKLYKVKIKFLFQNLNLKPQNQKKNLDKKFQKKSKKLKSPQEL
ncbi:hypothetical protein [Campylobacter sp. CCS1377]|uniref:CYTH domain-containing protein n=1 Tax=Campylobacter sp. CCS1377 TaxID=3158229 RepID=A0AAU7E8R6_9BACT|nr:hypothetical protein [Campylobacter jejuni]